VTSSPVAFLPVTFDQHGFFHLDTSQSDYVGYRPDTYSSTTPISLLVWMHGCEGQAEGDLWNVAPFPDRASQSYIAISLGGRDFVPGTNDGCWKPGEDGPKLLEAVKDVQRYFNINPRKVYVGGYSSGGDMAYRHGFENAGMFAGILAENSDPFRDTGSTADELIKAAPWKINVAHLAHTEDGNYHIDDVRASIEKLTSNGFPATLIEKHGTHFAPDDPGKGTGTVHDLVEFLLPFLDKGWVSP
jgi:predicted esterase